MDGRVRRTWLGAIQTGALTVGQGVALICDESCLSARHVLQKTLEQAPQATLKVGGWLHKPQDGAAMVKSRVNSKTGTTIQASNGKWQLERMEGVVG